MSEFSKADSSVYEIFMQMLDKHFPELSSYSFGLLFRDKVKKSRGGTVLASICQPTKLMSFYAKNDAGNPFDYLMIIDEMVWACASDEDRVRIVRHELRHCHITEKGDPKLVGHDFEDFYKEVEINKDNPNWANHLVEVTLAAYKQVKDGQKDPRVNRRDAEDLKPVTKDPQIQTKLQIEYSDEKVEVFADTVGKDVAEKIMPAGLSCDDLARKKGLLPAEA